MKALSISREMGDTKAFNPGPPHGPSWYQNQLLPQWALILCCVVHSLRHVRHFATPWTAACQPSLSSTISKSLLKLMSIQPSHPLLSPSPACHLSQHQGLSSESALHIRWPNYWSFSFSISPSNEYSGLISFRIDWFDCLAVQGTLKRVFSSTIIQKQQFFNTQPSLWHNSHTCTWLLEKP